MNKKNEDSNHTVLLTPAERKIFVVILYYLLFGMINLTQFLVYTRNLNHNFLVVFSYFNCQRSGVNDLCSLESKNDHTAYLSFIVFVANLLFPIANLIFVLKLSDFRALWRLLCCGREKIKPTNSKESPVKFLEH